MLAILSYLPFEPLYMIKAVSVVFDFILSIMVAKLIYALTKSESKAVFSYAVVLFLPTNIINSSLWGQCDSIYVTFVICSLYYLVRNCFKTSFVILGIAFAFKLQTIFIVPIFVYYYFIEKKYSILYFVFWISIINGLCIMHSSIYFWKEFYSTVKYILFTNGNLPIYVVEFPQFLDVGWK